MRASNTGTGPAYTLPFTISLPPTFGATTRYVSANGTYRKRCHFGAYISMSSTTLPLLLASASPRRRQILSLLGLPYIVCVSPVDEEAMHERYQGPVEGLAQWLAEHKALEALTLAEAAGHLVITADTTVLLDGNVRGKPRDRDPASGRRAQRGRLSMVCTVRGIRQGRNSSRMTTVEIILMLLIALCAIALGLTLRHFLVSRLKKTVLDNWVVQTLGAIVFVIPLIVGVFTYFFVLNSALFIAFLFFLYSPSYSNGPLPNILHYAWLLFWTAFALFVGVAVGRTVMKFTIRSLNNNRLDINLRVLIGRIFFIGIMIIDAFWVFAIWGVAIAFPVTVFGALTVTFTIAFQD